MSQTPAPPTETPVPALHDDWDKAHVEAAAKVKAALDILEQVIPNSPVLQAGREGLAAMQSEYFSKVAVQLRPQRDKLLAEQTQADALQGQLKTAMTRAGIKL